MESAEKKCFICGEVITKSSLPICAVCRQKDADTLLRIQAFHRENPKAGLFEIAEMAGIPNRVVLWYFNNGKLGYTHPPDNKGQYINDKGISITDAIYGEFICIGVSGKIDSTNALILQQHIDLLMENGWTCFIIDMNAVTFFSSTGIRVVMSAYKSLQELNGKLKIANPNQNVKNVLGMVALDTLLF